MLINRDLNPQLIYRLNRILYDILGNEAFLILPGIFDRYSRKFNWVGVHKNRWDDFKKDKLKNEIIKYIEENYDDWGNFLKKLDKKFIEETNTSFHNLSKKSGDEFYFHFLNLYSSYPIDSDKFIDGIVYKHFEKHFKYAIGNLCKTEEADGLKLVNIELYCKNNEQTPIILNRINQLTLEQNSTNNTKKTFGKWANANLFFLDLFNVIFYGKNPCEYKKKGHFELIFDHFMVFPIYDYYDKETSYGNFYGDLVVFYKEENSISTKLKNEIVPHLHLLSSELEKAAIHKILEQEIKKDTILEHFIEHLPILQDWECVMVQNTKIEYCYKRNSGKWSQCKPNDNCQTYPDSQLQNKGNSCQKLEIPLNEIFNHGLIPELDESDIKHCKSLKLICEYPSYTKFPDDEEKKKKFENFYKRQQLDLLRQLALQQKVIKETIKHGAKTARATIISGSVSHNIGSHVLSSINDEVIKTRRPDVERLICYVQQRMDYIAGVTSDYPLWSEPTFFFSDLLKVFFQQGLLLDYITKDDGVPGEKIKFYVKYKNNRYVYRRARIIQLANGNNVDETEKPCWGSDEVIEKKIKFLSKKGYKVKDKKECEFKTFSENEEDFLVSIPGGVIGRHAFYALLENFVRNGAKYGNEELKKSADYYHVHLEIDEKDKYFEVKLYDNWSKKEGLVDDIQKKLKKPIVQNDGSPTPGDWGIQEMKISTDYLASPHITERVEDGIVSEEFFVYEDPEDHKKYRIWPEGTNKLSYKFILQKSTLVVVADFNRQLEQKGDLSKGVVIEHVNYNEDLLNLVKEFSPQLLIIKLPEDNSKLNSLLYYLGENHVNFPSRVLLCRDNSDEINTKIRNIQGIPPRRYLTGNWVEPDSSNWGKFIINVYKEWIRRLGKLEQEKILNLVIYFDKDSDERVKQRWGKLQDDLNNCDNQKIVDISLFFNDTRNDVKSKLEKMNNIIVFDNHRKIDALTINNLSSICHLHGTGTTREDFKSKYIFDILQNFPDGFTGMYSLLLLLESAITKCLIIDERVIHTVVRDSVKDNGEICIDDKCRYLKQAGCYIPVHLITNNGKYLCLLKGEKFIISIPRKNKKKEDTNIINVNEGSLHCIRDYDGNSQGDFDYIIIHKSMLDTLEKDINLDKTKFIRSLYNFAPRVIITSGKGKRQTNKTNDEIDLITSGFLEYSILKQFTITELSKYHLNRIIFSINK